MIKDLSVEQLLEQIVACQNIIIQAYNAEKQMLELQKELERRKAEAKE